MGRSGPHLARFATGSPNGTQPHEPSIPLAINEHVIRWSEIRLPHPSRKGELISWKVDGPFSLRSYYEVEGSGGRIELDLSHRKEDGTIERCLHCGSAGLKGRMEASRASILTTTSRPSNTRLGSGCSVAQASSLWFVVCATGA